MEATHSKRTKIGPVTIRIELGNVFLPKRRGKGLNKRHAWMLYVQQGKGMGTIGGRTLRVGWRCRNIGGYNAPKRKYLFKVMYRTSAGNAGAQIVPGWWV